MLMNNALGVNSLLATQKVKCKPSVVIGKNTPVRVYVQIEGEGTESQPYVGVLYCNDGATADSSSFQGHWGIFNPANQQNSIITGGTPVEIEAGTHGGLLYTVDITVHGYAWTNGTYDVLNIKNNIINTITSSGIVTSHVPSTTPLETDNELGVILSNSIAPKCEFYIY